MSREEIVVSIQEPYVRKQQHAKKGHTRIVLLVTLAWVLLLMYLEWSWLSMFFEVL